MEGLADTFWGTTRASAVIHLVAIAFGGGLFGAGIVCFLFAYSLQAFGEITNFAIAFFVMDSVRVITGIYGVMRWIKKNAVY